MVNIERWVAGLITWAAISTAAPPSIAQGQVRCPTVIECENNQKLREFAALTTRAQIAITEGQKSVQIGLSYRFDEADVIVVHSEFPTGASQMAGSDVSKKRLRDEFRGVLEQRHKEARIVRTVQFIGHSDLEVGDGGQEYDASSGICRKRGIDSSHLDCLGLVRASEIEELFKQAASGLELSYAAMTTNYDQDVFMKGTNARTLGTLYVALDLAEKVAKLSANLSIPKDYDVTAVRLAPGLQNTISLQRKLYRRLFKEFRSVVVIVDGN